MDSALKGSPKEVSPLLHFLQRRDRLSAEEQTLIEALPRRMQRYRRGEEIIAQHSRPQESCLLAGGFAARLLQLADGRRQVAAMHIPGDFVDLHGLLLKVMDHSVAAVSDCRAIFVPHAALVELAEKAPHIGRLLWMSTAIDGAIQRAWIGCLGRRSAVMHLAHLICEMYLRLNAVDLAGDNRMSFPVTQSEMSDILGLSAVHVNRVAQELRRTGLITWVKGEVTIPDFQRLAAFADFDATYLNLRQEPR
ncbi:Crp/Fnr family transcriptional regulator [Roseococcus sp. SYP-B2431]|uniref:Crp/Fnr family transcriptional regulator n=1 Tax=Roseococcus sp. SYP-B2431 TaxID=2496640 RepID=UPI00103F6B9B|nr:Crp/Fnr family transcriptional regulator [Roseococcus sp. SYP-B2431]TCH95948.1 Crp/Fnr family transcriptional regulator [Roseococcus sp. SYP-B2431]